MSQKSVSPESSLMPLSVEQERDSYKEKVEHLKFLLTKYKQEIQTQKIRKEGVETVSKLLHETREENANLVKKNNALETVVRNLQSRLSSNGFSDGMTLEEGDTFIPGSSKQLLDNLARENKRLRSLLQGASTDPEEILKYQQILDKKLEENEQLKRQVEDLTTKLQNTERLLKASDCDKLTEISKLKDKVDSMKNECETRDILCSSLAEETNTLKQQLHEVASHCQKLATKLEKSEKNNNVNKFGTVNQSDMEKLLEENGNLKDKLSELVKMNKRWQEYMSQKEKYWQHMESNHVQPERIQAINAALEDASRRLQKLERDKKQLQEELDERNQQLISKSSDLTKLQQDLQNFRGNDDGRLHSDTETISALKAQIQICTEDFESERKDREKAQNRAAELEAELAQYKRMRSDDTRLPHQNYFEQRNPSPEVYGGIQRNPSPDMYGGIHRNPSPEAYGGFNFQGPYNRESNQLAARGPMRRREDNVYEMFNVVDSLQTDSSGKQDKTEKEGSNLATKLKVDKSEEVGDNMLDQVPDLNDFNSVDSDTEIEKITEIKVRKIDDVHLTHCPRCDMSFEMGKEEETRDHIEKCCD